MINVQGGVRFWHISAHGCRCVSFARSGDCCERHETTGQQRGLKSGPHAPTDVGKCTSITPTRTARAAVTPSTAAPPRRRETRLQRLDRLRAYLPAKDRKITLGGLTSEWINSALEASDRKATTKNLYS